eukprot:gene20105-26825_t
MASCDGRGWGGTGTCADVCSRVLARAAPVRVRVRCNVSPILWTARDSLAPAAASPDLHATARLRTGTQTGPPAYELGATRHNHMVVACKPGPMTVSLLLQQKDGAFVFTNPYSYALHGIITRSNFDTIVGQLNYAAAKLETEPKIGCVQRMLMKTPIISPLAAASIQRKMHTQMCTELEAACKRIKSEFAEQITMSLFAISDREYYRVDMDVK